MEETKCPICNRKNTEELFKTKSRIERNGPDFGFKLFSIRKCSDCGIAFTFPILDWTEVEKFYPDIYLWKEEYVAKNIVIKLFRKLERAYAQYILKYDTGRLLKFIDKDKREKILDVGCGNGARLETFKKYGFKQCHGIEPLAESAHYAIEVKKLPVTRTTLEKFNCPESSFDVVTLYHVFEHLYNPAQHLKIIRKILKPGGWVAIQVPNFDSWQAKLFKENWAGLDSPRHYFHYTPKTLSNLLIQNGFEIKTIDLKLNFLRPFFWGFSLSKVSPQLLWRKEERGERIVFCRIWWSLLMLLSAIPTELESLSGKGGHMTIYARKPAKI